MDYVDTIAISEMEKDNADILNQKKDSSKKNVEKVSADKGRPPYFLVELEELTKFSSGQPIMLEVEYAGEPSPTITWSKDGEILVETNRVTINKTQCKSILRISECNKKDAGMYKCRAANDHGISITEGQVIIEEDAVECFPRKKTPKPGADGGGGDPCMSEKREVKPKDDDSQENAKDEKSKSGWSWAVAVGGSLILLVVVLGGILLTVKRR